MHGAVKNTHVHLPGSLNRSQTSTAHSVTEENATQIHPYGFSMVHTGVPRMACNIGVCNMHTRNHRGAEEVVEGRPPNTPQAMRGPARQRLASRKQNAVRGKVVPRNGNVSLDSAAGGGQMMPRGADASPRVTGTASRKSRWNTDLVVQHTDRIGGDTI